MCIRIAIVHKLRRMNFPFRWSLADRTFASDFLRMQSIKAFTPLLPPNFEVTVLGHYSPESVLAKLAYVPPAVVILTKTAGYGMRPDSILKLRDAGVRVGIDHKDGHLERSNFEPFDFHISASYSGLRAINKILDLDEVSSSRPVFAGLLLQSPDALFNGFEPYRRTSLSTAYFGRRTHAHIPSEIAGEVQVLEIKRSRHMKRALADLRRCNFHYAVRPSVPNALWRSYNPFTKGMVAAACQSNVLIAKDTDDVLDYLPRDYPYLIPTSSDKHVIEGFNKAKEEFGGATWNAGLEQMRASLERVTPEALVTQFTSIVEQAIA